VNPRFLRVEDVLKIQSLQLEKDGGLAGLRDPNLLESAVMQPMATFGGEYLHTDLFLMAAAYLFHIVKNHPFLDANKRAGLVTALSFLRLNGVVVADPSSMLYDVTMAVAEGRLEKDGLAEVFRGLATSKS
jgi:death on curing protein